jgi:Glycosyl hydrolases family 18
MRRTALTVATVLAVAGLGVTSAASATASAPASSVRGHGMPAHVFAPYFETYQQHDSPALLSKRSGAKYLTLAFLETARRGLCTVVWNGDRHTPVSATQYGADIAKMRARGGDVIASFGGYSADHTGRDIADSCHSVARIAAAYRHVVSTYDLHRIDLDVEDRSLGHPAAIARRSAAIARVQKWARSTHRRLQVSLTIGTTPHGLDSSGLRVVRSAARHHMRVDVVNIMTFDYYDGQPHNMVRDAESAAVGLTRQLGRVWHRRAVKLWGRVGITEMVGIDDYGPPEVFYPGHAAALRRWASSRGLDTLSFWALQRDNGGCPGTAGSDTCSGVHQTRWAFSRALDSFTRRRA